MNTSRLIKFLSLSSIALGSMALVAKAQQVTGPYAYASNPGSTALERANDPFLANANFGAQRSGIFSSRRTYNGRKGTIDVALQTIAEVSSTSQMLNPTVNVAIIQSTDFRTRRPLEQYVGARIAATDSSLDVLMQNTSDRLTGETRAHALRGVEQRQADLEVSLAEIGRSRNGTWDEARSNLASNYQAYADAVAHTEAVATGTVASALKIQPRTSEALAFTTR